MRYKRKQVKAILNLIKSSDEVKRLSYFADAPVPFYLDGLKKDSLYSSYSKDGILYFINRYPSAYFVDEYYECCPSGIKVLFLKQDGFLVLARVILPGDLVEDVFINKKVHKIFRALNNMYEKQEELKKLKLLSDLDLKSKSESLLLSRFKNLKQR